MEKCVPANFTRSRQSRLLAVVPAQRRGEKEEAEEKERNERELQERWAGEERTVEKKRDIGVKKKRKKEMKIKKKTKIMRTKRTVWTQEGAFCNRVKDAHTHSVGRGGVAGHSGSGNVDTGGGFKCATKEVNL